MAVSDVITVTDLRRRPSACIERAEELGRPLYVTRRGTIIAVLITLEQYELMQRARTSVVHSTAGAGNAGLSDA